MTKILNKVKSLALTLGVTAAMAAFPIAAQAHGYSNSSIRHAQRVLKNDGYYRGQVDGIDGPMTHRAIRRFQRHNNLAVTGRLDRATRNELGAANTGSASRYANESESGYSQTTVKSAQRKLERRGFYHGDIDGIAGPKTERAIRRYQQNNNLSATGELNQQTLNRLGVNQ